MSISHVVYALRCVFQKRTERLLVKSISIATCLVLLYLVVSAATVTYAHEDLTKYLPTEVEMKAMFPWGQAHRNGGDPYRYGVETGGTGSTGEVARAYMYFGVQRWIDEVMGGSVTKNGVLGDEVDGGIELIQFTGDSTWLGWIRQHSVQEWREPELSLQNTVVVFQDVSVGDKSYAVSLYPNMDMSPENIDYGAIAQTKSVRICFIKGDYYVQVHIFGASEKLLEAFGKGPPSLYTTTEPYPTERSVITVDKVLEIARWVEAKLPSGSATTATSSTANTSSTASTASTSGWSFLENHPIASITGIAVGGIVAGFAVAGVASCVAEAGLIVGTTGVAEALISLPLVGGLFSRIIFSPWAMQMVGLYGQYVDDFVLWTTAMVDKVPAAINAVNHYFSEPKPQPRLPDWLRRHRP
jgi:hypothetical protein